MNAYDDGETNVVDVERDPKMLDRDRTGPNEAPASPDDWNVGSRPRKLRASRFGDRGRELPGVEERLVGKRYRYGYSPVGKAIFGDTLLKHHFLGCSTQSRCFGAESAVGECPPDSTANWP